MRKFLAQPVEMPLWWIAIAVLLMLDGLIRSAANIIGWLL